MRSDQSDSEYEDRIRSLSLFPQENPNPVLRVDRNGDTLVANPSAQQLINDLSEADHLSQEEWRNLIQFVRVADTRSKRIVEIGERVMEFEVAPIKEFDYVNLYGRDVSEERQQRRRLSDIAQALPGAIVQYTLHKNGEDSIVFSNRQCQQIYGLTEDQLAHPQTSEIWSKVHPDDLKAMQDSIAESASKLTQWNAEWRHLIDGETVWRRGTGNPEQLSNGDTRWNTIVIDITNEKLAVEASLMALRKTVGALAAALEARDPYTAGHESAVSKISKLIAERMGLDQSRVTGIELAATIHDVGKIAIPAEILSKPGRLSDIEFRIVQEHPVTGAKLMADVDMEWPIADIILQHHERLDGSGYPAGLKGDEIMLEARIIAVADTLEAMASHRPYRAGLGVDAAVAEIKRGAGTLYDPDVVSTCVALVESGEIQLGE